MPNYGDPKYWEQRYDEQKDTTFDWLEDFETIKPFIANFELNKNAKIINLGCGNSIICEALYDYGYTNIINIDICENVIQSMKNRNNNRPGMIFEKMDVRDLKYDDNSIDLAIDKSTIDAILCGDNSFLNVAIMTKEIQRVLKEGGIYMIISYGIPDNRMIHLEREHLSFNISIYTIKKDCYEEEKEKVHYVYICTKKNDADQACKENFTKVYYELEKQELLEENMIDDDNCDDL